MYRGTPGPTDATRYTIIYLTLIGLPVVVPNAMERTHAAERIESQTDEDHPNAALAEVLA